MTIARFIIPALLILALLSPTAPAEDLKLSKVSLFSSGVGYFQADGQIENDASIDLSFRTEQINDIIKSLILQDFDGGTIDAVQYAAKDPISKTLKSFAVDISGEPDMAQLFRQLRGVEVEITAPTAASGQIFGVEYKDVPVSEKADADKVIRKPMLTLLTADGLRAFPLHDVGGIKIKDPKVDAELRKALATLASSHDADKKAVTLKFSGKGKRHIRASYILEAPVWKTSYRLVLGDKDHPFFLQGWANVENTTEQDWQDINLSLVSGRPISFTMDMYTPLYTQRPVEQLELFSGLRPHEYEAGLGGGRFLQGGGLFGGGGEDNNGDGIADNQEEKPQTKSRRQLALESVANMPPPAWERQRMSNTMGLSNTGAQSLALVEKAGELFKYDIKTPVSIKRGHSAMLPIVTSKLNAKKLSIYNPATHVKYPLNGIELTNTSGLNLMQGPITIFDANTYAGDAKLPDLRPDEKRLLSYALDLGVEVNVESLPTVEEIVSLKIAKGVLWHRHRYLDSRPYKITNKGDEEKSVIIEQPTTAVWDLVEPAKPYEKAGDLLRFLVQAPPHKTIELTVIQQSITEQTLALSNADFDSINIFVRSKRMTPALKKAIDEVIARRSAIDAVARQRQEVERQISTINEEQTRIRENMKALPKESDILRRYLTKFDTQETQIETLRTKVTELTAQEATLKSALEEYLVGLNVE
jgi:hypothetical protein